MLAHDSNIIVEELTNTDELANARKLRARFDRNAAWFRTHAREIYQRYRGKCICIADEELFVANTPEEAIAQANHAHPDDDGRFVHYIPREKLARVYAN